MTLRCRHRHRRDLRSASFYKNGSLIIEMDTKQTTAGITVQLLSGGSSYTCKFDEEESEPVTVRVERK